MKLCDHSLRIREIRRMPGELSVSCAPPRWREAGAEINQSVTRQLLFSECTRDTQDLLRPAKRAMGLHVAEGPEWRQLGIPGDPPIFGHDRLRIAAVNDENVDREQLPRRRELCFTASKVERPQRLVNE